MKSIAGKLLMLVLCSLISTFVIAGGDTGWRKIESVFQRECKANKGLEVTFTAPHLNPDACANNRTVEVDCGLTTYKQILAMVLTAQSANLEISGFVNSCDLQGQANMNSIRIRQ